ncbi:ATP-binding cassette domain-containing protein [Mycoplasma sp. P36-A1]|uniref:ATP-binding cassette domain-containing protein n=1 Tax=Mycoplasma sp. P36-A1 TaxID=3252900 RepID=UPI003C2BE9C8
MLEIKNISKSIEDRILFQSINLNLESGSFIVITGVSGTGKSTLLNIIGGLDSESSGSIYINKEKTKTKDRIKKFDFLFQNYGLVESETIKYNLHIVKKVTDSEYLKLLETVKLTSDLMQYVYTLSGGEQQRLAIARLLLSNRDFILADEPTASLDVTNRDYIINMLLLLNKKGKTIILVTHDEMLLKTLRQHFQIINLSLLKNT